MELFLLLGLVVVDPPLLVVFVLEFPLEGAVLLELVGLSLHSAGLLEGVHGEELVLLGPEEGELDGRLAPGLRVLLEQFYVVQELGRLVLFVVLDLLEGGAVGGQQVGLPRLAHLLERRLLLLF